MKQLLIIVIILFTVSCVDRGTTLPVIEQFEQNGKTTSIIVAGWYDGFYTIYWKRQCATTDQETINMIWLNAVDYREKIIKQLKIEDKQ